MLRESGGQGHQRALDPVHPAAQQLGRGGTQAPVVAEVTDGLAERDVHVDVVEVDVAVRPLSAADPEIAHIILGPRAASPAHVLKIRRVAGRLGRGVDVMQASASLVPTLVKLRGGRGHGVRSRRRAPTIPEPCRWLRYSLSVRDKCVA